MGRAVKMGSLGPLGSLDDWSDSHFGFQKREFGRDNLREERRLRSPASAERLAPVSAEAQSAESRTGCAAGVSECASKRGA